MKWRWGRACFVRPIFVSAFNLLDFSSGASEHRSIMDTSSAGPAVRHARRSTEGPWRTALRKLRADRSAMLALCVLALIVAASLAAPLYARYVSQTDPFATNLNGEVMIDGVTQPDSRALDRGAGPRLYADRTDLDPRTLCCSAPTIRAATSPLACFMAGATLC